MDNLSSPPQSQPSSPSPIPKQTLLWIGVIVVGIVAYRFLMPYLMTSNVMNDIGNALSNPISQTIPGLNTTVPTLNTVEALNTNPALNSIPTLLGQTSEPTPVAQNVVVDPTRTPQPQSWEAVSDKLAGVMGCVNYANRIVMNTIDAYDRSVNFSDPSRTNFSGITGESTWENCNKDITTVLKNDTQTPELDASMKKFQTAGNTLVQMFKDITPYYKQKDYLDDNFAKGKEKHEAINSQIDAYIAASSEFRKEIDKQEDITTTAEIQALANDPAGKNRSLALQWMADAKKTVLELEKEKPVATDLEAKINALVKSQDNFKNTVLVALKADNADNFSEWDSVASDMEAFIGAAKGVWRNLRDNKPLPTGHFTDGSLENAITKFNDVVDEYNRTNAFPDNRL